MAAIFRRPPPAPIMLARDRPRSPKPRRIGRKPLPQQQLARRRWPSGFCAHRPPALPPPLLREGLEEPRLVGPFRPLPYLLVEHLGVLADQDAPAIRLHPVEDDLCGLRSRRRCV